MNVAELQLTDKINELYDIKRELIVALKQLRDFCECEAAILCPYCAPRLKRWKELELELDNEV